nr:nucleocapsid protein [Chaerephon pumilus bat alphacoronavirus/Bat143/Eswatini/2014]ULD45296.1 nucleocapsid protein [Chaerephon pumilus bat alphacoronavirus/Bat151/Eswatini/2014]
MASVSFEQQRGRTGRVPLSYYAPLMVTGDKPFWKVMPQNGVPQGKGNKDQQIGYWNEQVRWRTNKGKRVELPSKWHFYYLGTGPHAEKSFRNKTQGVYWVAVQGSKTENTNLGTRKRNQSVVEPKFAFQLPTNIQIEMPNSAPNSRSNSRSQSGNRSKSRDQSNNRSMSSRNQGRSAGGNQNGNNNNQSGNRSRNNSKSRDNSQSRRNNNNNNRGNNKDDLVAAVREALMGLGFQSNRGGSQASGKNTPKQQRSKSPARPSQSPKRQSDRPEWKRVPNSSNSVTTCFGPRDASHNFGDSALVQEGVDSKHYPQIAELVPTPAALLFGSKISVRENPNDFEIKFHYKMHVPKTEKALSAFLPQVDAYIKGEQPAPTVVETQLNPDAPVFDPLVGTDDMEQIEIIDQILDYDPGTSDV